MPPWEDRLLVTFVTVGEGRCPSPTKYMRRINRTAALRTICPSGKDIFAKHIDITEFYDIFILSNFDENTTRNGGG